MRKTEHLYDFYTTKVMKCRNQMSVVASCSLLFVSVIGSMKRHIFVCFAVLHYIYRCVVVLEWRF